MLIFNYTDCTTGRMYVSSQNRCTSQLGWWTCISIRCWHCQRFSKVCWECQLLMYLRVDGLESWWRQCSSILNPLMFTDNHNMSVLWLASFSIQLECCRGMRKTNGTSPERCSLQSYFPEVSLKTYRNPSPKPQPQFLINRSSKKEHKRQGKQLQKNPFSWALQQN